MLKRLATIACAVAVRVLVPLWVLGGLLPACSFVTDFGPRHAEYELSAHVVSADGTVTPVSLGDLKLGDPGAPHRARFNALTVSEADALHWWRRYLQTHVSAAGFGPGPWCLIQARAQGSRAMPTGSLVLTPMDGVGLTEMDDCPGLPTLPAECDVVGTTASLALGLNPVFYGTPSAPVPVGTEDRGVASFTNDGSGTLCLAFGNVLGDDAAMFHADFTDFTGLANPCTRLTADETPLGFKHLAAGETCALNVRFQPSGHGEFDAYLPVASNALDNQPQHLVGFGWGGTLTLTGDTPTTFDTLVLNPAHVCVPYAAPTGAMTYRRYLTLRNSGPGVVTLRSLAGATDEWRLTDFQSDVSGAFARLPGTIAPDFRPTGDVTLPIGRALRFSVQSTAFGTPPPLPPQVTLPFAGNQIGGVYEIHLEPSPAGACEP